MKKFFIPLLLLYFMVSCEYQNKKNEVSSEQSAFRIYSGDSLRQIYFPVGGIGTGNVLLAGRGNICEFEIFNQPDRDEVPPYMTFFALHGHTTDGKKFNRILEREHIPPFPNGFGIPRSQLGGLPRFKTSTFRGEFPFAWINFSDSAVPLQTEMEVFNPMIPLSPEKSGIPAAVFNWKLKNTGNEKMSLSLAFNMGNPLKIKDENGKLSTKGTQNTYLENDSFKAVVFNSGNVKDTSFQYGNICLATTENNVSIQTSWYQGAWWDNAQIFWNHFSQNGKVENKTRTATCKGKNPLVATVSVNLELKPGQEKTIPFYLTWYIPNRKITPDYALGSPQAVGKKVVNFYAQQYESSVDVATTLIKDIDDLYQTTKKYHDLVYNSTYPPYVIDALTATSATLKTNIFMRTSMGDIHGFEGLGFDFGCCAGSCTHVYNYAQTIASLYPSLERNMRDVSFLHNTHPSGLQSFRTVFPLGDYWFKSIAADGQMGSIVRAYREWKFSGNTTWLRKIYPKIKTALEFAWKGVENVPENEKWKEKFKIPWDPNKEGVLRGDQHNTYDINFFGANTMTGSLYLAALKATAEMAQAMNEPEKAREYMNLYEKGRAKYDSMLWNGEYYIQKPEIIQGLEVPEHLLTPAGEPNKQELKYQYGQGCLSDQLLGQYLAHVAGLGYVLNPENVDKAILSVYTHNFKQDISTFENVQRIFAVNQEPGLVTCTWPKGNRPKIPFVYSDEVWTGIEYQVAASLIYSGHVQQGLEVVKAVRDRYAGYNRNPFAEIESGYYYVRALSSWATMLALSGYYWDGVEQQMHFNPQINRNDFQTFWSSGEAWGNFSIKNNTLRLTPAYGILKLSTFIIGDNYKIDEIKTVRLNGKTIKNEVAKKKNKTLVIFNDNLELLPNDELVIKY